LKIAAATPMSRREGGVPVFHPAKPLFGFPVGSGFKRIKKRPFD